MQYLAIDIGNRNGQERFIIAFIVYGREKASSRVQMNVIIFARHTQQVIHLQRLNFYGDLHTVDIRVGNAKGFMGLFL